MRSTKDRIRQAVSFELIGLVVATPLFSWIFDHPMGAMGTLVIIGATAATACNYVFNLVFDHALMKRRGTARKTLPLRVLHAILFEATLLAILLPVFAWWLDISLVQAFLMDVSFAGFYLVYTFIFTYGYDALFPPQGAERKA